MAGSRGLWSMSAQEASNRQCGTRPRALDSKFGTRKTCRALTAWLFLCRHCRDRREVNGITKRSKTSRAAQDLPSTQNEQILVLSGEG